MKNEFLEIKPESIDLAYEILSEFGGEHAAVAISALVVVLTELTSQVCEDQEEARALVLSICDSVIENLKHREEIVRTSN